MSAHAGYDLLAKFRSAQSVAPRQLLLFANKRRVTLPCRRPRLGSETE